MSGNRQTFSTADLHASATRDAWRRYMGEVYFKLDIETDAEAIIGSLSKSAFEQLHFSSFQASSQRVRRSRRLALDDNVERFCFVFPTAGSFTCRQRREEQKSEAGGMYILNAAEAYEVDIGAGSGMVCLTIPCDLVRLRVRGIDDLCAKGGVGDPVLASTMRHMVSQALLHAPGADALQMQNLCIDMIDMMIVRDGGGARHSDAVAACLVRKLRGVIDQRSQEPDFDLAAAAAACAVSTRQLQAVLQRQGTTFSQELLDARLTMASRMLRSRDYLSHQIGAVAQACGFAGQAHFAHRYRERFGHTPSAERMLAHRHRDDGARGR